MVYLAAWLRPSSLRDLRPWSPWLSESLAAGHVDLLSSVCQKEVGVTSADHLSAKCILPCHQNGMATFLVPMIRVNYSCRDVDSVPCLLISKHKKSKWLRGSQSLKFIRTHTMYPSGSVLLLGTMIIRPTEPRFGARDVQILRVSDWEAGKPSHS